ncbi:hypothetical protein T484DRAFT_1820378, partial [Baffinella frigidus]
VAPSGDNHDQEANRSLRVLELEGNNLTDISVEEILVSLRRNRHVHSVAIGQNDEVSEEGIAKLDDGLAENRYLYKLDRAACYIQKLYRGRRHRIKKAALKRKQAFEEGGSFAGKLGFGARLPA